MTRHDRIILVGVLLYFLVFWGGTFWNAWQDPDSWVRTGRHTPYGCVGEMVPGVDMGDCP